MLDIGNNLVPVDNSTNHTSNIWIWIQILKPKLTKLKVIDKTYITPSAPVVC